MDVVSVNQGLVRGSVDSKRTLAVSNQGASLYQKFMPDYATLVAENRVWRVQDAAAVASVVALPTTTSLLSLCNNEPDDGLWYVLIAAYGFNAANAAAVDSFSIVGSLTQIPATTGGINPTPTQDIAKTSIKSMAGIRGGGYNGRAVIDQGNTITDDLWFPLGQSSGSTGIASAAGAAVFNWMHGLILLPPKTMLATATVATSTSCTVFKGLIWAEVPRSYLLAS